ncbi:hypothetical protein ACELLULO517_07595 [Acidisoma cellulosilytica]|uniref:Uncharacterized protein n=1 Tax=Acidisoma cellulosilyticum TaxID=2802395 RepID=A0A964E380_9PROT|nr:hypothetical protein [Acidisoma cellulosilyticum]MCB8880094.1 hypothetical protein [Acidisoma cellulosilyticum]
MRSLIIEFGRTGFGRDSGPPASLMLGLVRIIWTSQGVIGAMKTYEDALSAANALIVKLRGRK